VHFIVHAWNPNTQEDHEFEASLGYVFETLSQKTNKTKIILKNPTKL
jgi:hypothetical protein